MCKGGKSTGRQGEVPSLKLHRLLGLWLRMDGVGGPEVELKPGILLRKNVVLLVEGQRIETQEHSP